MLSSISMFSASGSSSSSVSRRSISSRRRSSGITAALAVKAAASELLSCRICSSCFSAAMPAAAMPSRSDFSSTGSRRITSARSSRVTLALALQIRSAAARFICFVVSPCAPWRIAVVASTSAQTWNRNWRTPSCTGTSLSMRRSSIVYWIASVSRCSTCWASETPLRVASFSFLK